MKYWLFHSLNRVKSVFSSGTRAKRMDEFLKRMNVQEGQKVIDLGGVCKFWQGCPVPLEITVLNLPSAVRPIAPNSHHTFHIVEGDACNVDFAADNSFDLAFSNSVIEHVGDEIKQAEMVREILRLAPNHWVQTPSIWFPMEAHSNMPFWWFYPRWLQDRLIVRWRKKLPAWTQMIVETSVLLRPTLKRFFPDSTIWTERVMFIAKSYVVYRTKD